MQWLVGLMIFMSILLTFYLIEKKIAYNAISNKAGTLGQMTSTLDMSGTPDSRICPVCPVCPTIPMAVV
jgi:hypothetical protein